MTKTHANEVDEYLEALEGFLLAADLEPRPARYNDEQLRAKLQEILGGEPAPEVLSWFRFTERWRVALDPSMSGLLDIDSAADERNLHGADVEDSGMIVATEGGWDLIPIGSEESGSIFVLSPATLAGSTGDKPRVCSLEFGESFFFVSESAAVRADRSKLPTLADWLRELVAAHREDRIVYFAQGGFLMANVDVDFSQEQEPHYPWPLLDLD